MVALWILGILLALILLVLFLRVGCASPSATSCALPPQRGLCGYRSCRVPEKAQKQKKHKEKKNPPEKQKAAPREKRKLGLTPGDIRSALPYLWQSLKGALRKTRQRLRIDPMQVSVILGGEEDPAASAETYGWVSAAVWTFMPRLEELMRIPDPYIHLDVDYSAAETKAEGEVGLSFQIRDLFAIGFAFGIPVLKWLLRWKKEKKLREEAQKAENPEKPQEPVTNDEKAPDTNTKG